MHQLKELFATKLLEGLSKRTVTKCSEWAIKYRVMGTPFPGPWTFDRHPWLREMHDSEARMNIGQKSAQMGYTETVLNWTFYNIHIKNLKCLYVLPALKPDATDFTNDRFNPAIENSTVLKNLFSDINNVGLKRAGTASLYIRGSHVPGQLKSIPTPIVVVDERDEMVQENIPLIWERQAGQQEFYTWQISTPTYPDFGINQEFNLSSQNHFFFKCPHCSRFIELVFPDSFVVTGTSELDPALKESYVQCTQCKHKLDHDTKPEWLANGKWIESFEGRDTKGWYINQLYSTVEAKRPFEIAKKFFRAKVDPAEDQQFHNSIMGLPHIVSGSSVTDEQLNEAIGAYPIQRSYNGNNIITMGVDVGYPDLHYEVDEWFLPTTATIDINQFAKCRVLSMGIVHNINDLSELMRIFKVLFCVIDAQPERRMALEFANLHYGRVRLCTYEQGITGKSIHIDSNEPRVKVDRTSWLDLSLINRFKSKTIKIPNNTTVEYRKHIKAQVRVYEKDSRGNPTGRYITPSGEDHFGHARNYAEIALPQALEVMTTPIDITGNIL
jgi:hypothetical protein